MRRATACRAFTSSGPLASMRTWAPMVAESMRTAMRRRPLARRPFTARVIVDWKRVHSVTSFAAARDCTPWGFLIVTSRRCMRHLRTNPAWLARRSLRNNCDELRSAARERVDRQREPAADEREAAGRRRERGLARRHGHRPERAAEEQQARAEEDRRHEQRARRAEAREDADGDEP